MAHEALCGRSMDANDGGLPGMLSVYIHPRKTIKCFFGIIVKHNKFY